MLTRKPEARSASLWKELADLIVEETTVFMVGNYEFIGPFKNEDFILALPGLLAVLTEAEGKIELLDVVESHDLRLSARAEALKSRLYDETPAIFAAHYRSR